MDRQQIARTLRRIADTLDNRVEIWVQVVDPTGEFGGRLAERIYQGSFLRHPPPIVSKPLPLTRRTQ